MSEATQLPTQQQRVGRRLGLEPYYTVTAQDSAQLELTSRPEVNRTMALTTIGIGTTLVILGLSLAISGIASAIAGAGFGVAAIAAVLAGLIGGFGYQRIIGGYAILTTHNRITCDRNAGTITFWQDSKIGRAREQRIFFAQINGLRLRRRPLAVGWPLRRITPIVALELTINDQIWVIDSANDPEALRPAAEGFARMLDRPLQSA
ncbi:hypothetical protein [Candidatus Viridilinea mediisalina]|uniref:Uncharacterized protein n=1 Tax=Candidatus Viridilinea mediisalina TaxID=2024553 RepID=A0A2A6RKV4_9CHLR|nr:hypothetical protein [Candidatus Viridilinea mediisalina]PDW03470.1 hypothetical protein CJ255_08700 [Candidatus Viridilinea mediisalina]